MLARKTHRPAIASPRSWHLWWLNPVAVMALMLLATAIPAYLIPESAYQTEWKTPKYLGPEEFLYILYVIGAFALGASIATVFVPHARFAGREEIFEKLYLPWNALRLLYYAVFVIILVMYAVWLAILVGHGVSIPTLVAGLLGKGNASFDIKGEGATVPGVTTLVQLEMAFLILGLILLYKNGWKANFRSLVVPLLIVCAVAWMRSKIWSERLAVIEMAVPAVVLIARFCGSERFRPWTRTLIAAAPLAAPPLLFAFFSAAEYSRSWSYYGSEQDSFFLFSFMRLIGYYVTALNNGAAAVLDVHHYNVPYETVEWFWKLPPVKSLSPYESLTGFDPPTRYTDMLADIANPEFNNPSGIFVVRLDWGYTGGLFVWCAFGILSMVLYRWFISGTRAGLFLYPLFFVGLLESPRIFYWGATRVFPSWIMLLGILLLTVFTAQAVRPRRMLRGGLVNLPAISNRQPVLGES